MQFKDYYAALGLDKSASADEIKKAYRKLARKYHPDVNPGDPSAEARFKELTEAYEVLGDPAKRRKYDELGANWRYYEQAQQAGQGFPGGFPFGGGWSAGGGGAPGGFRTMTDDEVREMFGDDPFSDFFKTFFGGGDAGFARAGRGARARSQRGRDLEQPIELSLEDVLDGVTRHLTITVGGHARTVDVRIPPGVNEGSRVRVPGEGAHGTGGAAAGDLYLRVHLKPHPVFERRGRDLQVAADVPVTTAVLGGEVQVPTLGGRPVRLKIPPMTQPGQVFRIRAQGMPALGRPDDRGDLYATVNVRIPTRLTPEQRRHYEALAELETKAKTVVG